MRKTILFILFSLPLSLLAISKEEAIDYLINTYPKARIVDVYKSFYQDNYGPGHLLGDSISAIRYFNYELEDTMEWGGPAYEFTGEGKNFMRLNMNLIRTGKIPKEEYFKAFKNSLGQVETPVDEYWISEWNLIDSIINRKDYHFIKEDQDKEYIKEKIETRNFPIHHSENFNDNYKFHYRIISIPEFEKLKDKYLIKNDE